MSKVIESRFDSVWDALESDATQAENLKLRSSLMMAIAERVKAKGWTQAAAAAQCNLTQPRVNDLLRGRISRFSLDALVNIAAAMGQQVHVRLQAA